MNSAVQAPVQRSALAQRQVWIIFGGVMLGSFLGSLDQTVVATALPTIVRELGTASQLSWVVTGYLLASTVATGLWGKLSDVSGRKAANLACTAIFLLGSALSGQSQSMLELILFRALQGVGGGGLTRARLVSNHCGTQALFGPPTAAVAQWQGTKKLSWERIAR